MARQFDTRDAYLLLEAFDRLGQHLYGEDWTGTEPWARPTDPPNLLREKRKSLGDRILELDAVLRDKHSRMHYAADEAERAAIAEEIRPLEQEKAEAERVRADLPIVTDSYMRDHDGFVRRERAEAELFDALRSGEIVLRYGTNLLIPYKDWSTEPGFKLHICLSMATASPKLSGLRRAPVTIDGKVFDQWLSKRLPINLPPDSPQAKEAALADDLRRHINSGDPRMKRPAFLKWAKAEYKLGARPAGRVWDSIATPDMKHPGRPRKPEKS